MRAWVRFLAAWLWSRRLTEPPRPADAGGEAASLREAPLPQTPSSEERLGIGLCVSSDLCAHAAWVRFLAAWLWSRRLTEPPRPADAGGRSRFSERSASPPRPPTPEEQLGIGLCVSSDLCAHAAWVRFHAIWLWSRRDAAYCHAFSLGKHGGYSFACAIFCCSNSPGVKPVYFLNT